MARAVGIRRPGGHEVVAVIDRPVREPGENEVRIIESVGPGVERLAVGDRVMAAVSPRRADGGAQCELLGLAPGETLAVSGGAGILASYVIALAHEQGLRVLADAKPPDTDLVRSFGADVVLSRSEDFAAAVRAVEPDGVDAVYDTALLSTHPSAPARPSARWMPAACAAGC
jgi:NADPH2:quinone reductase